jgi:uncharacterized protein (DUF58 family)
MSFIARRWQAFIEARSPRRDVQVLNQRNLYIVPSKGGWGYAGVVLVLLLAAINEQLNLGYALAFLLGGVGLSGMSRSHGNLRGLRLSLGSLEGVHAGQTLSIPVLLDATTHPHGCWGVVIEAPGQPPTLTEVAAGHQQLVHVQLQGATRGWLSLPRVRILSRYPLGLFSVWGYWRPAQPLLIWPALETQPPPLPTMDGGDEATGVSQPLSSGQDEQLREWRQGDSLRQVAWKKSATRLASGLSPVSRDGTERVRHDRWLRWDDTIGLNPEARLSRLAAWLVLAEQEAQLDAGPYGLKMPGQTLPCSLGPAHLKACLDLLGSWGHVPPETHARGHLP